MKITRFFLLIALLLSVQSIVNAACWVRNKNGKWYHFPTKSCKDFNIDQTSGELCVECCAINGQTVTPITNGLVTIEKKVKPNGDVEIYDKASNELISTLKGSSAENFDDTVYYSQDQGFGMRTELDGKTYLVSDDGDAQFELSEEGKKAVEKEGGRVHAIVAEEK